MMLVSAIPLVLLVVITSSRQHDDLHCETTQTSAADGSAELATSAAAWSPVAVTSTDTLQTAAPNASLRLADPVEEEAPDYYDDQSYEATSAGDQSSTGIEAARVQDYEPPDYYDDEPPVVSPGGHGAHLASVSEEGVSSTATQESGTASFGKSTAPSGSRATVSTREEAGGSAAPEPSNWISWLPSWCRDWPLIGPLGVPRDVQLQAYAEALAEQTVGITNYWLHTAEPAEPSTEEPQTHFVSIVMRQVEMLLEFYKWMYQQLNMTESGGDCIPESLDRFLRALRHHTTMVKSISRFSPSARLTCSAPEAGILRDFFWSMDRLIIWVHVLHNWAANQYNLASWCLPFSLNESTPFNASYISTWNLTGDSVSGLEAASSTGVCTAGERDVVIVNENSEDLPSGNYCSNRQLDQQAQSRERKWPSCVLQSISTTGHGNEQLTATDGMPVTDNDPEMLLEECGDSPPRYGLHSDAVEDIHPDDGIYEDQEVMDFEEWRSVIPVVQEETEEEEVEEDSRPNQMVPDPGNLGVCPETSVKLELGRGFHPSSLQYVRCDERDSACPPPQRCTPVSSLATLAMAPWAALPEFPHSYLGALRLPNGSVSVSLLVASSCACLEPFQGS